MLEYYGNCGPETYVRAADEFGFDPHYLVNPFQHASGLACLEHYALPGVDYRREERTHEGYRIVTRTFRTPDGTLTDETRFPPADDRRYGISPNPFRKEYLVKSPDDLKALRYLVPEQPVGDFAPFREAEQLIGDRGLVEVNIYSQLCHRAGDVHAMEDLMVAFYEDRPFFDALVGMYHEDMMREVRACLEEGIRHLFANGYYNSLSAGWSPRIWNEVFAPQLKEMTSLVHQAGGTVNLYDDGKLAALVEALAECEIDVLQTLTPPPVGDVDLADVKRRIGDRVCLMGYVDLLYVIQKGTPELIDRAVKDAVVTGAPGGGFILGTSDSIRDGTPIENVRAYFDAARKYGEIT